MKRKLLLAVDIGTTNTKGALFDEKGGIIASASCRHDVDHPHEGWAEHDADNIWWNEFRKICKILLEKEGVEAEDIVSIGISSLTPALLPIDQDGNPLRPAMLYSLDTRAEKEIEELNNMLGKEYTIEQNMRPISQKSIGPKILWIKNHEPEVFKKAIRYMGAASYLIYRLTGEFVADYGCYKLSGIPFSFKQFGWDERACNACGITLENLPELKFATEAAGTVSKLAEQQTGLKAGTVVAVGTGDFLAETLSYGTSFTALPQISYGTCIGVDNGNDHAAILFSDYKNTNYMHSVPGGSMSNGCANIDWINKMISGIHGKDKAEPEELSEMAASVEAGAEGIIVLPYFNGEKTPVDDPKAKGLIFGLQMRHTQAHLYKAFLEGATYSVRHVLSLNPQYGHIADAVVMGGGTKIPMLLQTVSDVTGLRQISLESYNGALVGDAFIAGMACGMFRERKEINLWVKTAGVVEPRKEMKSVYDRGYEKYLALYRLNKELMY